MNGTFFGIEKYLSKTQEFLSKLENQKKKRVEFKQQTRLFEIVLMKENMKKAKNRIVKCLFKKIIYSHCKKEKNASYHRDIQLLIQKNRLISNLLNQINNNLST